MRISLIGAASVLAFLAVAQPVLAADLPKANLSKTAVAPIEEEGEAPPPIPVFGWAGPYAGVQAGYAFGRDHVVIATPGASAGQGFGLRGIAGGAHVGYNFATAASLDHPVGVFGLEGDIEGADLRRRGSGAGAVFSPAISGLHEPLHGSLRLRAGVGVQRVLYYGTGGLALASATTRVPGAGVLDPKSDRTLVGYTLGGGVAYAMTNHVALRAEYRYTDFGRVSDAPGLAGLTGATISHRDSVQRLQGGVSYLFADPVAAPRAD